MSILDITEIREERIREELRDMTGGNGMVNGEFLNRKQKKGAERLLESSCVKMYSNHNSEAYRTMLLTKLLNRKMKKPA
jgi:hypothetical protein